MRKDTALYIVFWISLLGILFSGTMTIGELSKASCDAGGCNMIFGMPVCVYGLAMYVIIFLASVVGLKAKK